MKNAKINSILKKKPNFFSGFSQTDIPVPPYNGLCFPARKSFRCPTQLRNARFSIPLTRKRTPPAPRLQVPQTPFFLTQKRTKFAPRARNRLSLVRLSIKHEFGNKPPAKFTRGLPLILKNTHLSHRHTSINLTRVLPPPKRTKSPPLPCPQKPPTPFSPDPKREPSAPAKAMSAPRQMTQGPCKKLRFSEEIKKAPAKTEASRRQR